MKNIEIDEELYQYIVNNTQSIGESASSILRRLLNVKEITKTIEHNVTNEEKIQSSDNAQLIIDESLDKSTETISKDTICETKALIEEPHQKTDKIDNGNVLITGSFYDYINKEELAVQRGAVGRFLLILGALYRVHSHEFLCVCDIRGRDRLYFANNEAVLDASGSSTKPRQIPESPYWVITNSNTTRKKMMLTEVAISLGYSAEEAEDIRDLL